MILTLIFKLCLAQRSQNNSAQFSFNGPNRLCWSAGNFGIADLIKNPVLKPLDHVLRFYHFFFSLKETNQKLTEAAAAETQSSTGQGAASSEGAGAEAEALIGKTNF